MKIKNYPAIYLSALMFCMPIHAEETKPVPLWKGEVEFGFVDVSGNTEESSTKARLDINRDKDEWRYNIHAESLNSESNGDKNAEKYFLSNRLAYQFTDVDFIFVFASYDKDRFSGFDNQVSLAAGYGRRLLKTDDAKWDIEVGIGYRESTVEDDTIGEDTEEAIVRLFSGYDRKITETTTFEQSLNVEAGEDITVSKLVNAITVAINSNFGLKVSHAIKYTDEVPEGRENDDTETAVTLTYSF